MSGINICATLGGNAGKGTCDVRMGRPKVVLPTRGKVFSANDLASSDAFKVALLAAMLLARTDANKVFAFPAMRIVEDNTADVTLGTLADGYEEVLNESLPLYKLQSTVGVCQQQAMCQFNGWTDKIFIVDHNNVLWYVQTSTGGGQGWSVGNLYTNPPKFGNTANIQTADTRLAFGSIEEFKSSIGAIKLGFDVTKLTNTVDVDLLEKAAAVANVITIGGTLKCIGLDIYDSFSTLLNNAARWVVKNVATGATIPVTSVALAPSTKGWALTIDTTIFTGLAPGAKISINIADPATLNTAGAGGIEGIEYIFTKP